MFMVQGSRFKVQGLKFKVTTINSPFEGGQGNVFLKISIPSILIY
jgi:hypothetical protein